MQKTDSRIIVALDYAELSMAEALVEKVSPDLCKLKVGKEMFTRFGPGFVEDLCKSGFDVFLDLKFHDIPNTVAKACEAAADLGVWMTNVHAQGGQRMMTAAKEALIKNNASTRLIAVTVLTSMDKKDLELLGISQSPSELAQSLAKLSHDCGLDGIVCSAQEASQMRSHFLSDFLLVTPGIRPSGSESDDQRRIMTPADAIKAGSSYLVIGRPITKSDDPVGILRTINSEITDLTPE
ncbi:MAG: orotidine-5'-phosphate decarboxylase [Gammaproteobacteria bacterium]|nr:orotidine-5'-phosphate decarboxylase [Gammaproteobacteria bacterium]